MVQCAAGEACALEALLLRHHHGLRSDTGSRAIRARSQLTRMSRAYLQLAAAVLLNVASYLIYRSITGLAPRLWWPLFLVGLLLGAANTLLCARALHLITLSIAFCGLCRSLHRG